MKRLLSLVLPALFCITAQANLLVNPGFELPGTGYASLPGGSTAITGWTTVNNGVEWFNAVSYGGAADGVMIVDLANYTFTGGGIQQAFATVPGNSYRVEFALGTMAGFGRVGTAHIDVLLAGQAYAYDVTNLGGTLSWQTYAIEFTATDVSTLLRFTNSQNPLLHFANVDAVSAVEQIPEPATAGGTLACMVLALAALQRRRRE